MIKTLLKSLREFKRPAILTMLVMIGEVVMEALIPYVMASLIDKGFKGDGGLKYILLMGALLVGISIVSLLFGSLGSIIGAKASAGFAKNMRDDMFKNVQKFSFSNIDKFSTSSIITRLTTDVSQVQNAFTMCIRMAVRTPMTLIFSSVMMFFISWKLAVITLCAVPILAGTMIVMATKVFPIFTRMFKKIDKLNNNVQESLHGIRVVKSFVRADYESEKFGDTVQDIYDDSVKAERIMSWNSPIIMGCMYAIILLMSFLGAYFVIGKEPLGVSWMGESFTVGNLNSVFTYSLQILSSCMMLSMVFVMLIMSRESMRRIAELLEEKTTLENPVATEEKPDVP